MPFTVAPPVIRNMVSQQSPIGVNEQTIASGLSSGSYIPLDTAANVIDPGGYITTVPIDYYGAIPAGRAFELPAGTWAYGLIADWDTNTTGLRMATVTNVDERVEVVGQPLDSWLGDPTYGGWVNGEYQQAASRLADKSTYRPQIVSGVFRTQQSYDASRWAIYVAQDSGAPRVLKGWTVQIHWLGSPA